MSCRSSRSGQSRPSPGKPGNLPSPTCCHPQNPRPRSTSCHRISLAFEVVFRLKKWWLCLGLCLIYKLWLLILYSEGGFVLTLKVRVGGREVNASSVAWRVWCTVEDWWVFLYLSFSDKSCLPPWLCSADGTTTVSLSLSLLMDSYFVSWPLCLSLSLSICFLMGQGRALCSGHWVMNSQPIDWWRGWISPCILNKISWRIIQRNKFINERSKELVSL